MPIKPYLKHGAVFTPEALAVMGKAFDRAATALGIDHNELKRKTVAQFIIELALSRKRTSTQQRCATRQSRRWAALGGRNTSAS